MNALRVYNLFDLLRFLLAEAIGSTGGSENGGEGEQGEEGGGGYEGVLN